jgi:hypothetical protein
MGIKRLFARLLHWLLGIDQEQTRPDFIADKLTMIDPTTGKVLWSISKGGGFEINPDAKGLSGSQSGHHEAT